MRKFNFYYVFDSCVVGCLLEPHPRCDVVVKCWVTMKMSMNGKQEKWNKTKKPSGIPFNLEKLRETAAIIKDKNL
jgi:hypothetical protein